MCDYRGLDEANLIASILRANSEARGLSENGNNNSNTASPKLGNDKFAGDMWDILDRCGNLLLDKQDDYGPLNISNAPGGPLNGLRVRIYDKVARINHLVEMDIDPKNESLRDSFMDLANYAIIALMVIDKTWPELPDDRKTR